MKTKKTLKAIRAKANYPAEKRSPRAGRTFKDANSLKVIPTLKLHNIQRSLEGTLKAESQKRREDRRSYLYLRLVRNELQDRKV